MSVGKQLLFSILANTSSDGKIEQLGRLSDSGVTSGMFPNEDERRAYSFMMEYRGRYGVCPSLSLVEVETEIRFPQYASQNPFEFWLDEFRNYVRHTSLIDLLVRVEGHLVDGRVSEAINFIGEEYSRLRDLMQRRKTVMTLGEMADDILEKHRLLQTGALQEGTFTGFPYIDDVTGGIQPGDLWVIAGESSTGKTYILCRCTLSAVDSGRKALFLSMEMPGKQLGRRALAMGAGVSATNFRLGRLSHFAVSQVRDFVHRWGQESDPRLILIEGRVNYSIKDIKTKILEERPQVVFIDGAYMLRTGKHHEQRWAMNMEAIENLKQIAMEENIGIAATFQFDQKQRTKGVSTIMGGQAIGQIASVVIGIENEEGASAFSPVTHKELTLYKGREGERGKIRLRYDMDRTIIAQDRVISGMDDFEDRDDLSDYNEEY